MTDPKANQTPIPCEIRDYGFDPIMNAIIEINFAIWTLIQVGDREAAAKFLTNVSQDIREGWCDEPPCEWGSKSNAEPLQS